MGFGFRFGTRVVCLLQARARNRAAGPITFGTWTFVRNDKRLVDEYGRNAKR